MWILGRDALVKSRQGQNFQGASGGSTTLILACPNPHASPDEVHGSAAYERTTSCNTFCIALTSPITHRIKHSCSVVSASLHARSATLHVASLSHPKSASHSRYLPHRLLTCLLSGLPLHHRSGGLGSLSILLSTINIITSLWCLGEAPRTVRTTRNLI